MVMLCLDGFVFFNSDRTAGASMGHKHLQAMPIKSFSTNYFDKLLDIVSKPENYTLQKYGEKGIAQLRFPFYDDYKYVLVKFRPFDISKDSFESYAAYVYEVYQFCRRQLGVDGKTVAFNLAFGPNWMFMVLRK